MISTIDIFLYLFNFYKISYDSHLINILKQSIKALNFQSFKKWTIKFNTNTTVNIINKIFVFLFGFYFFYYLFYYPPLFIKPFIKFVIFYINEPIKPFPY